MLENEHARKPVPKVNKTKFKQQTPEQRQFIERLAKEQGVIPIKGTELFPARPPVDDDEADACLDLLRQMKISERYLPVKPKI